MNWHPSPEFPTQFGLSRTELQENRDCQRSHRDHWTVVMRNGNRSAFNGYHWTPSAWSAMRCTFCGRAWRTRARYVRNFPDAGE